MKTPTIALVIVLALGALAGCDRNEQPRVDGKPQAGSAAPGGTAAPATPRADTPSTPANVGTPTQSEKAQGSNPVQGQVDPKQPEQHKDFQQKR